MEVLVGGTHHVDECRLPARRSGHDKEGPVSGLVVPPADHRACASGVISAFQQINGVFAEMDAAI